MLGKREDKAAEPRAPLTVFPARRKARSKMGRDVQLGNPLAVTIGSQGSLLVEAGAVGGQGSMLEEAGVVGGRGRNGCGEGAPPTSTTPTAIAELEVAELDVQPKDSSSEDGIM